MSEPSNTAPLELLEHPHPITTHSRRRTLYLLLHRSSPQLSEGKLDPPRDPHSNAHQAPRRRAPQGVLHPTAPPPAPWSSGERESRTTDESRNFCG